MQVIGEDADCDGLKRMLPLNQSIDPPQAIDLPDEQVARTILERHREEVEAARKFRTTIP